MNEEKKCGSEADLFGYRKLLHKATAVISSNKEERNKAIKEREEKARLEAELVAQRKADEEREEAAKRNEIARQKAEKNRIKAEADRREEACREEQLMKLVEAEAEENRIINEKKSSIAMVDELKSQIIWLSIGFYFGAFLSLFLLIIFLFIHERLILAFLSFSVMLATSYYCGSSVPKKEAELKRLETIAKD